MALKGEEAPKAEKRKKNKKTSTSKYKWRKMLKIAKGKNTNAVKAHQHLVNFTSDWLNFLKILFASSRIWMPTLKRLQYFISCNSRANPSLSDTEIKTNTVNKRLVVCYLKNGTGSSEKCMWISCSPSLTAIQTMIWYRMFLVKPLKHGKDTQIVSFCKVKVTLLLQGRWHVTRI